MSTTMKQQGESSDLCLSKFFKVYIPLESGDDLELPISFNISLPRPLPRTVTVRSIYGNTWKMELRKSNEKYVLVDFWKRIVKDEGLTGGEFLAFEFDGSRFFNFCIYERDTMCKRVGRSSVSKEDEESDEDDDDVIVLDSDNDDSDDMDYEFSGDNDVADDDIESLADDDVEDVEDDDEADDEADDDYRQYLDDCNNPSFPVTLNPKKKSQLHIPAFVIKDYGLNFSESITVVDPLATKFGTFEKKIKIQVNGSVFVKGFGSVIRRNNVKVTDKMICELKKTGNNLVHTIKVYIIYG